MRTRIARTSAVGLLVLCVGAAPLAQADPTNGCHVAGASPDTGAQCSYVATGATTYDAFTPQSFTVTATYKDRRGRTRLRDAAGGGEGTFQRSGTLASRKGDRITVVVRKYSGGYVPVTGWAGFVRAHDTT